VIHSLLLGLLAFLVAVLAATAVKPLARACGAVAMPRNDRWNRRPVPLFGGVAIVTGVLSPAFFLSGADAHRTQLLLVIGFGLFCVGLYDDLRPIRPQTKLIGQILAAALVATIGFELHLTPLPIVNTLLTMLWVVALTNAFNLLDNMDGLAAGIGAIAAVYRLFFFAVDGDATGMAFSAILAGALSGFLVHNAHPASIFMGDAGSLFLGFCVASLSLSSPIAHTRGIASVLIFPVAILVVPILDTAFVTVTRILTNRSIAVGGRDHTSHRLVQLGMSERRAVGILYLAAMVGGAVAVFSRAFGLSHGIVLLVLLSIGAVILGAFLSQVRIQGADQQRPVPGLLQFVVRLPFTRQLATVVVDTLCIVLGYYCAYLLRFEEQFASHAATFARSLPIVLACQLASLSAFHTYRGVWRYTTLADVIRVVKGISVGSLLAVVAIAYQFRFAGFSRAVFVLDWVLLVLLAVGTRASFRVLGEVLRPRSREGRPVLIYGADDAGERIARELLRPGKQPRRPIGFLDDDPAKRGTEIHTFPVLGGVDRLSAILRDKRVAEVLVSSDALPEESIGEIDRVCREHHVPLLRVSLRIASPAILS
jgi:UDP-GlcNAc:undecaprenyl-phosphate/decaprenyl-phosphate GlcNAc-1-phosphate transferase